MPSNMEILDPTAHLAVHGRLTRRALADLRGKIVGLIDNSKPNFNFLADELGTILTSKYGVKSVLKHRKRAASLAVSPALLDEWASHCDLVITGSGD